MQMNGLFDKEAVMLKVMVVLAGLVLVGCGSGGGDGINLDTGGGSEVCDQLKDIPITNTQATLTSADERAVITVPQEPFGSRQNFLSIRVDCNSRPQLIGRSYIVAANQSLTFTISVSFAESDVAGIDRSRLQLGTLDLSNGIWTTVPGSGPDGSKPNTFSGAINTDNAVFGIYVTAGGSSGSPPTAPTNVVAVPRQTCAIDISWSASQDSDGDLQSYIVFRDDGANLGTVPANTCFGTCSFQDIDNPTGNNRLLRFTRHTYFIRATDVAEHSTDSADSNQVSAPSSCPLP
jgi:hypothetical protein